MARNRFFVDKVEEEVVLLGDEFNHAKNVLRLKVGSEVTLLDGSGKEYSAIVSKAEKNCFHLHVLSQSISDREPKTEVYLLIGALKGDKTELVVQKATELGVSKIGVFSSAYCAAYMNENKLERLTRVAKEAAKQCMRTKVPEIFYFENFKDALSSAKDFENKFIAYEGQKMSERELLPLEGSSALVIGSEGGFQEEEMSFAVSLGFSAVTLGKRILRAETAAIALLSVAMYGLGEMR